MDKKWWYWIVIAAILWFLIFVVGKQPDNTPTGADCGNSQYNC